MILHVGGQGGHLPVMADTCDHDWQTVNHDGNVEVLKCMKCGELKRN